MSARPSAPARCQPQLPPAPVRSTRSQSNETLLSSLLIRSLLAPKDLSRAACSVSCGDAPEGQAAGKAMLGKAALCLARAIEARNGLAADIHDLAIGVGAQSRERGVQNRS